MSTLGVFPNRTSPRDDAIALYCAFNGAPPDPNWGSFYHDIKVLGRGKAATVVEILAHRDATERALIQKEYEEMYSDDFHKRLSSVLHGKLETSVLLWMHDLVGRDATVIKQGLSSETKNLRAATEVICSRTPSEIQSLKQHYHSRFGVPLEHDIEMQASGDHKELLLAYVCTPRDEGLEFDSEIAAKDSKALFKAGEKQLGTDEKTFIHIFSERSKAQLAAIIPAYRDMYGNSLKKAVKGKTPELFQYALLTILSCSENPARYFAKVLRKAMKGLGTDDTTLIRVIVTRAEIDMQDIKAEYLRKYEETLYDAVHSDTSGHYRTFLLSLLGPNH